MIFINLSFKFQYMKKEVLERSLIIIFIVVAFITIILNISLLIKTEKITFHPIKKEKILLSHSENIKEIETLNFIDISKEMNCISYRLLTESNESKEIYVINNQEEFNELIKKEENYCKDFKLPEIDFSKNTLIGWWQEEIRNTRDYEGCKRWFEIEITKDNSSKKINYKIKKFKEVPKTIGQPCLEPKSVFIWSIIPKIPFGYKIEFEEDYTAVFID